MGAKFSRGGATFSGGAKFLQGGALLTPAPPVDPAMLESAFILYA